MSVQNIIITAEYKPEPIGWTIHLNGLHHLGMDEKNQLRSLLISREYEGWQKWYELSSKHRNRIGKDDYSYAIKLNQTGFSIQLQSSLESNSDHSDIPGNNKGESIHRPLHEIIGFFSDLNFSIETFYTIKSNYPDSDKDTQMWALQRKIQDIRETPNPNTSKNWFSRIINFLEFLICCFFSLVIILIIIFFFA